MFVDGFTVPLRSFVTWEIGEWQARVTVMSRANHNCIKDVFFSLPIPSFCLDIPLTRVGEIRPLFNLQNFRLWQRNSPALAEHQSQPDLVTTKFRPVFLGKLKHIQVQLTCNWIYCRSLKWSAYMLK